MPKSVQVGGVAQGGGAAGRYHLGLEPIGAHLVLVVLGDVQGNHLDAPLRLGHRFLVGVPAAYPFSARSRRFFTEHGVEQPVQALRPFNGQFGQPRFVEDRDAVAPSATDWGMV